MTNAFARGVPGIAISRPGVWSYGPERRKNNKNPKGYHGSCRVHISDHRTVQVSSSEGARLRGQSKISGH